MAVDLSRMSSAASAFPADLIVVDATVLSSGELIRGIWSADWPRPGSGGGNRSRDSGVGVGGVSVAVELILPLNVVPEANLTDF